MYSDTITLNDIQQAHANIRLESLELSEKMKELLSQFTLDNSISTADMLDRLINE